MQQIEIKEMLQNSNILFTRLLSHPENINSFYHPPWHQLLHIYYEEYCNIDFVLLQQWNIPVIFALSL